MKLTTLERRSRRQRRHAVRGTADRPRLSVFRSNKHISAQLIDDNARQTLLVASDTGLKGTKTEKARGVGVKLAKAAVKMGLKKIVFDRRHYRYHGRVAALAEAAREAGLEF